MALSRRPAGFTACNTESGKIRRLLSFPRSPCCDMLIGRKKRQPQASPEGGRRRANGRALWVVHGSSTCWQASAATP